METNMNENVLTEISLERREEIIKLAKTRKYTVSQIAEKAGVLYAEAYRILKKEKLLSNVPKRLDRTKKIIKLAKTRKYTVSKIAEIEGISYNNVYKILERNNMLEGLVVKKKKSELKDKLAKKNKLELQDKVNAIKMYLCGKDLSMIARKIGCQIGMIEEYLNSIKLSSVTLGLLHDNKVSSEYISNKYGIPINLVEDWRAVISREQKRQEELRNNRIELVALKLRNELSEEDINLIKAKLDELDVSINDLINIVEGKRMFKIEQAIFLTENAARFNIPKKSIAQSIIDNYFERKNYGKALRYFGIYSKEFSLEEKNKIISYVQNAKDENER